MNNAKYGLNFKCAKIQKTGKIRKFDNGKIYVSHFFNSGPNIIFVHFTFAIMNFFVILQL
jgi:hypothetical protein